MDITVSSLLDNQVIALETSVPELTSSISTLSINSRLLSLTAAHVVKVGSICDATCLTCSDVSSSHCTSCDTGYTLEASSGASGQCVSNAALGLIQSNTKASGFGVTAIAVVAVLGTLLLLIILAVVMFVLWRGRVSRGGGGGEESGRGRERDAVQPEHGETYAPKRSLGRKESNASAGKICAHSLDCVCHRGHVSTCCSIRLQGTRVK